MEKSEEKEQYGSTEKELEELIQMMKDFSEFLNSTHHVDLHVEHIGGGRLRVAESKVYLGVNTNQDLVFALHVSGDMLTLGSGCVLFITSTNGTETKETESLRYDPLFLDTYEFRDLARDMTNGLEKCKSIVLTFKVPLESFVVGDNCKMSICFAQEKTPHNKGVYTKDIRYQLDEGLSSREVG